MLSVDELQERIRATLTAHQQQEQEHVPLDQAQGRILAQEMISNVNIPPADVSAMDGYALAEAAQADSVFSVIGESIAGKPFEGAVQAGQTVRIMTGAVVPAQCRCVIMQEHVRREADRIVLTKDCREGANIRRAGEELRGGDAVLYTGRCLNAADILLLASLGIAQVPVFKKLRVAVFSTGDELLAVGETLSREGQIYDSNRAMICALLRRLPVEIVDMGLIADDIEAIKAALAQAGQDCDAVITSGGVSVGDYDFLKMAVEALGEIHTYKVKMKPGKPFVFGKIGRAVYFGLPGNPVSGYVGMNRLVNPALRQMAHAQALPDLVLHLPLNQDLKKSAGRRDFQRGVMQMGAKGWEVGSASRQDSHRVHGLSSANCLIDLPEEMENPTAGTIVAVHPFFSHFSGGD